MMNAMGVSALRSYSSLSWQNSLDLSETNMLVTRMLLMPPNASERK